MISSHPSLLFSKLNKRSFLSLSSYSSLPIPLITSVALLWTLSSLSTSFLHSTGLKWTQHSRCGLTRPHKCWVEWDNDFFISAGDVLVDATQHPVGFLYCSSTTFTCIEPVVQQDPQIPFHRAAHQLGRSQPVLHSSIMFSQVWNLTHALAELRKVLVSSLFQPTQVFLQGGSSFTYEDTKQRWAQCGSLGDPTCDRLPVWKGGIYHHTLGVTCQPVPHPLHRLLS